MRVLIYKRTHIGDPGANGVFGELRCMGRVRSYQFDAAIGVGGISGNPVRENIDRKINWIGIRRHEVGRSADGFPKYAFERFYLREDKGLPLKDLAPRLAKRLYSGAGVRYLMIEEPDYEISAILHLARNSAPSPALTKIEIASASLKKSCKPKKNQRC